MFFFRNNQKKRSLSRGISVIEVMIVLSLVSVTAAVSVPIYVSHLRAEKQKECPQMLKDFYQKQKKYYAENGYYTADLRELNWYPLGSPRYLYGFRYAPNGTVANTLDPNKLCKENSPHCYVTELMVHYDYYPLSITNLPESRFSNDQEFLFGCVGNLDRDHQFDLFTINHLGELVHVQDDLIKESLWQKSRKSLYSF